VSVVQQRSRNLRPVRKQSTSKRGHVSGRTFSFPAALFRRFLVLTDYLRSFDVYSRYFDGQALLPHDGVMKAHRDDRATS
jgi:hypothetical protein